MLRHRVHQHYYATDNSVFLGIRLFLVQLGVTRTSTGDFTRPEALTGKNKRKAAYIAARPKRLPRSGTFFTVRLQLRDSGQLE